MSVIPATTTDGIVVFCVIVAFVGLIAVVFPITESVRDKNWLTVVVWVTFEVEAVAFIAVVLGACVVVTLNVGIVIGFSPIPLSENILRTPKNLGN